jgi:hypothetical protein
VPDRDVSTEELAMPGAVLRLNRYCERRRNPMACLYGTKCLAARPLYCKLHYVRIEHHSNVRANEKPDHYYSSLPLGGWLDDDGSGSAYWRLLNTDPHSHGTETDIYNPAITSPTSFFRTGNFLATGLQHAIGANNSKVKPALWENTTINQLSLSAAMV